MLKKFRNAIAGNDKPAEALAPSALERLRRKRDVAAEEVTAAKTRFRAASLEAEEAPEGMAGSGLDDARRALQKAEARLSELDGAINEAQEREAKRAKALADAEWVKRWDLTAEHANARLQAAERVQKAVADFAAAVADLTKHSDALVASCPIGVEPYGHVLGDRLWLAIRLELVRRNFRWAAQWPWELDKLPALTATIADANALMLGQRADADKRKAG